MARHRAWVADTATMLAGSGLSGAHQTILLELNMQVRNPRRLALAALAHHTKTLIDMSNELTSSWEGGILLDTEYVTDIFDDYNLWAEYPSLPLRMTVIQALLRTNGPIDDLKTFVALAVTDCKHQSPFRSHDNLIEEVVEWLAEVLPKVR